MGFAGGVRWEWWLLLGARCSPLVAQTSRNRGENRERECDGQLAWVQTGRTVSYRWRWTAGGEYPLPLGTWVSAGGGDRQTERETQQRDETGEGSQACVRVSIVEKERVNIYNQIAMGCCSPLPTLPSRLILSSNPFSHN